MHKPSAQEAEGVAGEVNISDGSPERHTAPKGGSNNRSVAPKSTNAEEEEGCLGTGEAVIGGQTTLEYFS